MNGVILIDKPAGMTSRDVVDVVQKRLGVKKAGHAGTLDPLATGVLVVCINEATKLVQFLSQDHKEYEGTMILGLRTDTWDREGKSLAQEEPRVNEAEILETIRVFRGKRTQAVPAYSAVKYRGKPLYKWARQGAPVEVPARAVEIHTLELIGVDLPYVTFTVSCSKGTYIRSLCHEIGEVIGCGACLWSLRRTRSGTFSLQNALPLEEVDDADFVASGRDFLISMADALPSLKSIEIDQFIEEGLKLGRQPSAGNLKNIHMPLFAKGDVIKFVAAGGGLVAVAETLYGTNDLASLPPGSQVARVLRVFGTEN
ncbi:MAG: tRNA pseudouridine(55) synthase TruB [Smithellaceae bacterium]|nr:tRNA pseudouridine(55) synthase TruB [Smithellaceae bacterium]